MYCRYRSEKIPYSYLCVFILFLDFQVTEDSTTPIPEHKVFNSVVDPDLFNPDLDFISKVIPYPDPDPSHKLEP
jgi:hypothetical protein